MARSGGARLGAVFVAATSLALAVAFAAARACVPGSRTRAAPATEDDSTAVASPPRAAERPELPPRAGDPDRRDADTEDMASAQARRLITKTRAAYAACATYEDDGTIDTVFRSETPLVEQVVFHTTFAGPEAIRLAYRALAGDQAHTDMTSQLIVNDAGATWLGPWSTRLRRMGTLEAALGAMASVSGGLTRDVLPLLPNGVTGAQSMLDVASPAVVGTEEVDGETCDVVEGMARRGAAHVRISIAQRDSLIRRITEDDDGPPGAGADAQPGGASLSTFNTTTFRPRCGRPVDPDAVRFTDGSL